MARFFLVQLVTSVLLLVLVAPGFIMPLLSGLWLHPLEEKLKKYTLGGTVAILAETLESTDHKQLQKQFPSAIGLGDVAGLTLNNAQLEQLQRGEVVYEPDRRHLYKLLSDGKRVAVLEDRKAPHVLTDNQLESMGTLALLQDSLAGAPESEWVKIIAEKSVHFHYPIQLLSFAELPLSDIEFTRLRAGEIVAHSVDDAVEYGSGLDYFYQAVPGSDKVIGGGPVSPKISEILHGYNRIYFILLGVILTVPLCLWLIPTWRTMKALARAAADFGRGNFASRVDIFALSHLNTLARVFNLMAEKTRYLFHTNKMLTLALTDELNAPLQRIESRMALLRAADNHTEFEYRASEIESSMDELKNITSDMLLFARFDGVQPEFSPQTVALGNWLREQSAKWQVQRSIVSLSLAPSIKNASVQIEPYFMGRALESLVNYTLKQAQHKVSITAESTEDCCRIIVDYDGEPMEESQRETIFSPYLEGDAGSANGSQTTWLALAVAEKIVRRHKGKLLIGVSDLGGGRFSLVLPRVGQ